MKFWRYRSKTFLMEKPRTEITCTDSFHYLFHRPWTFKCIWAVQFNQVSVMQHILLNFCVSSFCDFKQRSMVLQTTDCQESKAVSLSFEALFANALWFNTCNRTWNMSNSLFSPHSPSFGGGKGQISRLSIWHSLIVQDTLELVRMSFSALANELLQFTNLESVIFISKLECKWKKAKEEEMKKYVIQFITKCFYYVGFLPVSFTKLNRRELIYFKYHQTYSVISSWLI